MPKAYDPIAQTNASNLIAERLRTYGHSDVYQETGKEHVIFVVLRPPNTSRVFVTRVRVDQTFEV